MDSSITGRIKAFAGVFEKFVEHNLIEKDQRDENMRKLALAFENFVKKPGRESAEPVTLRLKKLPHFKGELPKYQTESASGIDVRAQISEPLTIAPGSRALVPTGLMTAVPKGYEIQARPRSGLAIREGLTLLNTPGTIDSDYRGEVKIILINLGDKEVVIKDQDRIAQLCICPIILAKVEEVDDLDATTRGEGGFGSTGRA